MALDWFVNIDPPHCWNFRNGTSSQAPLDGKELKIDCYEEEQRPHCSKEYWSVFYKLPISRSAWRKGDTKGAITLVCFAPLDTKQKEKQRSKNPDIYKSKTWVEIKMTNLISLKRGLSCRKKMYLPTRF